MQLRGANRRWHFELKYLQVQPCLHECLVETPAGNQIKHSFSWISGTLSDVALTAE